MTQLDLLVSVLSLSIPFIFFAYAKYSKNRSTHLKLPLPPGPKKLPLIGNLFDFPVKHPWLTYHKWCKELNSDIIHLNVVGTSMIVLNTIEAATELLEKRSSMYSGRPRLVMVNELMGWDFTFALTYGDKWRQQRKLVHHGFQPSAAQHFRPQELKAAHRLLLRILDKPENLMGHFRYLAGETIISVAYGLDVLSKNDPYITLAENGVSSLAAAAVPGAFLVDLIPPLKYVPDWMPFASFKRKAKEWQKMALSMRDTPFDAAKENIENGGAIPSFVSQCLAQLDESQDTSDQEFAIKSAAATMYTAGADTTVSSIATCVFGLLANPVALKKAQDEIDLVVGHDRLPDFEDEESLPYVSAIVTETLRWREVLPMGVPHLLTTETDDEYKGYRIPAGSIVIPNQWAMLHNEATYPDPFKFNPDRFLKDGKKDPDAKDPGQVAFGFGRRICPGRFMARSAIWIAVASLIAAFDIKKAVDENGEIIEPSDETHTALVSMPLPFKCSMKPRSKQMERLIRFSAGDQ